MPKVKRNKKFISYPTFVAPSEFIIRGPNFEVLDFEHECPHCGQKVWWRRYNLSPILGYGKRKRRI